jgi:hypothetical protein
MILLRSELWRVPPIQYSEETEQSVVEARQFECIERYDGGEVGRLDGLVVLVVGVEPPNIVGIVRQVQVVEPPGIEIVHVVSVIGVVEGEQIGFVVFAVVGGVVVVDGWLLRLLVGRLVVVVVAAVVVGRWCIEWFALLELLALPPELWLRERRIWFEDGSRGEGTEKMRRGRGEPHGNELMDEEWEENYSDCG